MFKCGPQLLASCTVIGAGVWPCVTQATCNDTLRACVGMRWVDACAGGYFPHHALPDRPHTLYIPISDTTARYQVRPARLSTTKTLGKQQPHHMPPAPQPQSAPAAAVHWGWCHLLMLQCSSAAVQRRAWLLLHACGCPMPTGSQTAPVA